MINRSDYVVRWSYNNQLAIAATFFCDVGGNYSNFQANGQAATRWLCPIRDLHFFSLDVYTDNTVEVDIQVGMTAASVATMVTLFCGAVLRHNTIYDLPLPYSRAGYLTLTGRYCRIQVRNTTGAVVDPFTLEACLFKC